MQARRNEALSRVGMKVCNSAELTGRALNVPTYRNIVVGAHRDSPLTPMALS